MAFRPASAASGPHSPDSEDEETNDSPISSPHTLIHATGSDPGEGSSRTPPQLPTDLARGPSTGRGGCWSVNFPPASLSRCARAHS